MFYSKALNTEGCPIGGWGKPIFGWVRRSISVSTVVKQKVQSTLFVEHVQDYTLERGVPEGCIKAHKGIAIVLCDEQNTYYIGAFTIRGIRCEKCGFIDL